MNVLHGKMKLILNLYFSSWGFRKLTLEILNICIYKYTAKTFCFDNIPDGRFGKIKSISK